MSCEYGVWSNILYVCDAWYGMFVEFVLNAMLNVYLVYGRMVKSWMATKTILEKKPDTTEQRMYDVQTQRRRRTSYAVMQKPRKEKKIMDLWNRTFGQHRWMIIVLVVARNNI